jgi:hypothetical protein
VSNACVCVMVFQAVYISRIVPGGIADQEGSLRLNDRLLSVKDNCRYVCLCLVEVLLKFRCLTSESICVDQQRGCE